MTFSDCIRRQLAIDPSGCLLWTGYKTRDGYGLAWQDGRHQLIHRLAYVKLVGPIPVGLTIDHLCRVRNCANPDHLEPVTQRENALRGQTVNAENAAKTHCLNGHPYDEANTYVRRSRNGRDCRTCISERSKKYRLKKAARGAW